YEAIGNCYRQLGDFKNAVLNYKKAVEINPDNSETYYAMGVAYLEANNQDKAKEAFQISLKKDSKNIKSKKMLSFIEQKVIVKSL
ncbi:MAG: tetratricopeptide repeat protein, partial [bacterium]|nr:tetratricopeptide repeat protein [bacterium]